MCVCAYVRGMWRQGERQQRQAGRPLLRLWLRLSLLLLLRLRLQSFIEPKTTQQAILASAADADAGGGGREEDGGNEGRRSRASATDRSLRL